MRAPMAPWLQAVSTAKLSSGQENLEVVPHARVAGINKRADVGRAPASEGVYGVQHAVVLGDDVPEPPECYRIEQPAGLLEVGDGDIAEHFYAQDLGAEVAGSAAGGVTAVCVGMRDFRVDDDGGALDRM